jgi:phage regulator Rha-like protein
MAQSAVQIVPVELIERRICLIRGCKVMLDSDLAALYEVPTKRLNEAVRRNLDRFPEDFMFQLTPEDLENLLRSQFATSNVGRGGRRYQPYAFTEHGVAMLSSVLSSKRAVALNILIIRAFVRLREYLMTHHDLARKLEDVERTQQEHGSHIQHIYDCIERLLEPPPDPSRRPMGF